MKEKEIINLLSLSLSLSHPNLLRMLPELFFIASAPVAVVTSISTVPILYIQTVEMKMKFEDKKNVVETHTDNGQSQLLTITIGSFRRFVNGTCARMRSHITLATRIHGGSCRASVIKSQFSSRFVSTPFPVRTARDMSLGLRSLVNLWKGGEEVVVWYNTWIFNLLCQFLDNFLFYEVCHLSFFVSPRVSTSCLLRFTQKSVVMEGAQPRLLTRERSHRLARDFESSLLSVVCFPSS